MSEIIFITGGARSGKSRFAEKKVAEMGKTIAYIATAVVTDDDMADRIKHHQASRPQSWQTIEKYQAFQDLNQEELFKVDAFILDCVTVMVTNLMMDSKLDFDVANAEKISELEAYIKKEIEGLLTWIRKNNRKIVIVSNEVGLGLVPAYRMGSIFRDIAGRMNQFIAEEANQVFFVVSGIPMKVKG